MPTTDFIIKEATEEDASLLLSFIRSLAEYERLSHEVSTDEQSLKTELFGPRPVAEAVIGYYRGEPVGFALYFHNFSTFKGRKGLYLEDLFIQPQWRGRGFGRELLLHLARLAKQRGCARFEWAVLDWNQPAIDFYKKLGAIPMDDWTTFRLSGDALDKLA